MTDANDEDGGDSNVVTDWVYALCDEATEFTGGNQLKLEDLKTAEQILHATDEEQRAALLVALDTLRETNLLRAELGALDGASPREQLLHQRFSLQVVGLRALCTKLLGRGAMLLDAELLQGILLRLMAGSFNRQLIPFSKLVRVLEMYQKKQGELPKQLLDAIHRWVGHDSFSSHETTSKPHLQLRDKLEKLLAGSQPPTPG